MSDKAKRAIAKAEVAKAMEIIRDWCESRDALVECYKGCPMGDACCKLIYPCDWKEFCE